MTSRIIGAHCVHAKNVYDFDTNLLYAFLVVLPAYISCIFEGAVFAGAKILPMVLEGLVGVVVEIDCPKIDEIERGFNGSGT